MKRKIISDGTLAEHVDAMVSVWRAEKARRSEEDRRKRNRATDSDALLPIIAWADIEVISRHRSMLKVLAEDPIAESLRIAAHQIGKGLHDLGGIDAMEEADDRLWDIPECGGAASSFFNHQWDGIGTWMA